MNTIQKNLDEDNDFIGLGWAFPIRFNSNGGAVEKVQGPQLIETSITLILSTAMSERVPRPRFGCDLNDLIHGKINQELDRKIRHRIEMALVQHEPRITVENVKIIAGGNASDVVNVEILYLLRTTNTRYNMVYPVYLDEMSS